MQTIWYHQPSAIKCGLFSSCPLALHHRPSHAVAEAASSSELCVHRRTAARVLGSLAHQIQAEFHCNFAGIDRTLPGPRLMEPVSLIGYHADADGNYIVESRHL